MLARGQSNQASPRPAERRWREEPGPILWRYSSQEPTSVNSMTVGSPAMREWGVPGAMWSHDPGPSSSGSPSTVKLSRPVEDLNHGSTACLMLGEPLAGVEAEHGHVHPVASMYDLGDNGTGLDDDCAGRIGDQRMGHSGIIVSLAAPRQRPVRGSLERVGDGFRPGSRQLVRPAGRAASLSRSG